MSCGWQMFFSGWALFWVLVSPFALYYVMLWPARWRKVAAIPHGPFDRALESIAAWTFIILFLSLMIGIVPITLLRVDRYFSDGFMHLLLDGAGCNQHPYGSRPGIPTPIFAGAIVGAMLCLPAALLWVFIEDLAQRAVVVTQRYFSRKRSR